MGTKPTTPPRPLAVGDIVAAYSEALGEWTAVQITHFNPHWSDDTAGVLDLDWSGPQPHSLEDIGELVPLRRTHGSWGGGLSHCNHDWLLPRGASVIGNTAVLEPGPSDSYLRSWNFGQQLARQRRWDNGDRSGNRIGETPGSRKMSAAALDTTNPDDADLIGVWDLHITDVTTLDCGLVVERFPNLVCLGLRGNLGRLHAAARLNELPRLKELWIIDLFGMTADDCLLPRSAPALESLHLHSIPAEYAAATKRIWRPEIVRGTRLSVSSPRKPEWLAENLDNPLREWDGREHISATRFKNSVAQYKASRRAVLDATSDPGLIERETIESIGREFATAFNALDRGRSPFIETEEREELFAALDRIVDEAELKCDRPLDQVREWLLDEISAHRDW